MEKQALFPHEHTNSFCFGENYGNQRNYSIPYTWFYRIIIIIATRTAVPRQFHYRRKLFSLCSLLFLSRKLIVLAMKNWVWIWLKSRERKGEIHKHIPTPWERNQLNYNIKANPRPVHKTSLAFQVYMCLLVFMLLCAFSEFQTRNSTLSFSNFRSVISYGMNLFAQMQL